MIMACELKFDKAHDKLVELLQSVADAARQGQRVDVVERELLEKLMELGLIVLTEYVVAAGDGDEGESIEREGRTLHRLEQPKTRTHHSIFGKISCERYVYGSREKQKVEWIPLDSKLGMPAADQSYVLEDLLQKLVVQLPYGEAVGRLEDFLGVRLSQRSTQVMTGRLAHQTASFRESQSAPPTAEEGQIVVLTLDGKGVPMRRPLEERLAQECGVRRPSYKSRVDYQQSTKRRGRGKPKSRKQMAYVGVVYTIDRFRRTARDVVDEVRREKRACDRPLPQHKRVWAELTQIRGGDVYDGQGRLFAHLTREVRRRQQRRKSKPLVCLMDGQRSFRKLFGRLEEVTPILDLFHGIERLWNAAHCFHPDCSLSAERFVDHNLELLLEGKVGYVIGNFKRLRKGLTKAKRSNLEKVITYLQNNRQYMQYDDYLRAGYPIGSGVVEGACRHVVKDRMERSGMRWEAEGAQAVLDLRTIYLNGDWAAFIEHRIQTEQAALYATAA